MTSYEEREYPTRKRKGLTNKQWKNKKTKSKMAKKSRKNQKI